ncbi:MAG: Crp/Fnr family transcriptional regulator [Anaerolineae bacterium]|nr:Crp/Fnr family transcriptional regulator [Anaerolineae bacterium]
MISIELLRRYPFFGGLSEVELKELAMISEEIHAPARTVLFEEGQSADAFYLLLEGTVDLLFNSPLGPETQIHISEVNPGEPFAISSLIPPYILKHTARAATSIHAIKIAAAPLRELCRKHTHLCCALMTRVAEAAMERLEFTRVQLAAAQV